MNTLRPILLIEDNALDAELTNTFFKRARLSNPLVRVEDGVAAISYLQQQIDNGDPLPVAILLDINLPGMTGIEILHVVKAAPDMADIPVVMLTGSRSGADIAECHELGADAYVVKPLEVETLFDAMQTVGTSWAVIPRCPKNQHADRNFQSGVLG
jgi:two-component system, response regulator